MPAGLLKLLIDVAPAHLLDPAEEACRNLQCHNHSMFQYNHV